MKVVFKPLLSIALSTVTLFSFGQEKQLARIQNDFNIPGLQVAYSSGDQISYYANGVRSLNNNIPIDTATVFQAASLSKVVFGYIAMKLQERGVFDLDTPLSNYMEYERLSEIPVAKGITARHVLTHRTGLPNWQGSVGSKEWATNKLTTEFAPGAGYRYSGEGFYYLQIVIEHLTGKSLNQIATEEVFVPFGMVNSSYNWIIQYEENAAAGHKVDKTPLDLRKNRNANSAYTLYTTAADYLKFVQKALFEGEGLKPETYKMMISKQADIAIASKPKKTDKFMGTGMAVRLQESQKGIAYWHTGSNPGFRCYFIAYPDTKEILTVFTNSENGTKTMEYIIPLFLGKKIAHHAIDWSLN